METREVRVLSAPSVPVGEEPACGEPVLGARGQPLLFSAPVTVSKLACRERSHLDGMAERAPSTFGGTYRTSVSTAKTTTLSR